MNKVPSMLEVLTAVAQVKASVKDRWSLLKDKEKQRVWLELRQMKLDMEAA